MHVFSRLACRYPQLIRNSFQLKSYSNITRNLIRPYKNYVKIFGCTCITLLTGRLILYNSLLNGKCEAEECPDEIEEECEEEVPVKLKLGYREIWVLFYPDILLFFLAVFAACVAAIINTEIPLQLGVLVNSLTSIQSHYCDSFWDEIKKPSLKLLCSYIIQALSTTSYISLLSMIGERMAMRMRLKLFERIIMQDTSFFDQKRSGDLLNRLSNDIQDFKSSFKQCISIGLRSVIQIIGSSIALVFISPHLTVIVMITIPGIVIMGSVLGRFLRRRSREAQAQHARVGEVATEAVANIGTVKSFAMEDIEITTFSKEVELLAKMSSALGIGIGVFQGLSNLAINGIVFSVLFSGGYMMTNGSLTPGDLISFMVASQTIQRSLAVLSTLFGQIVRAKASGARITEFLELESPSTSPLLSDLRAQRTLPKPEEITLKPAVSVKFKKVFFQYPTRKDHQILGDFSLYIPKGSVVAICGESGAGKSTITSLLQRFYDVTSGQILIDNVDIRDISVSELRTEMIGVVSQQPSLFATTIRENIQYGRISATNEEIEDAAKRAQAHDFILGFKQGYDTLVGERGGEALSGGQRQRIAIARAILKNPRLLILDEATSALDTNSEVLVQNALQTVMKGRTVIIIAHRLSTIRNADTIVVLKHGRIVEVGDHEFLMQRKGYYFHLVRKQEETEAGNNGY